VKFLRQVSEAQDAKAGQVAARQRFSSLILLQAFQQDQVESDIAAPPECTNRKA
jgi:hypothetical protein